MLKMDIIIKAKQFIKFGIVGLGNNVVFLLIYYLLLYFKVHYLVANVFAYILSSITGYILNKLWVFEAKNQKVKKSLFRYYIVYGSSFLINISVMYILVGVLSISEVIAPYLILCITIPYNFVLSKIWVYSRQ